jgi:hypothetical protein
LNRRQVTSYDQQVPLLKGGTDTPKGTLPGIAISDGIPAAAGHIRWLLKGCVRMGQRQVDVATHPAHGAIGGMVEGSTMQGRVHLLAAKTDRAATKEKKAFRIGSHGHHPLRGAKKGDGSGRNTT